MLQPELHSTEQLKSSKERLNSIMDNINRLRDSRLQRRAAILAGQSRIEEITRQMGGNLQSQDEVLDKLKELARAR